MSPFQWNHQESLEVFQAEVLLTDFYLSGKPVIAHRRIASLFEKETMRIIRYKQSEFLMPWKWRKKNPVHRFILDIPYALYFSVVPGREALNEVLRSGSAGGGMGTGLYWDPFETTRDEYDEITEIWRSFDLRKVLKFHTGDIPDLRFIFDDEIVAIPHHLDYLSRSRVKYEARFRKQRS